tara:strand:+ start:1637 stop:1837 length:201 start_codon:yes stop_codon:yes gene_type:complete
MLLTPQHRRSERRNRKTQEEYAEEEDIYSECPTASFYYDKDMYLGSDNYATLVDNAIKTINQTNKK